MGRCCHGHDPKFTCVPTEWSHSLEVHGAKDIVRRFGMERLKSAVYAVEYEGLQLSQVSVKEKQR
jgi:hypothetical protein